MFSPEIEAKIDKIIARYPFKRSAILPLLHLAQIEQGKVSETAMRYIADRLDLLPVEVYEVVTFYIIMLLKIRDPAGNSSS